MICGDPVQTQQEIKVATTIVQALATIPIFAIISWQIKSLFRSLKELKAGIANKIWSKKK